ncbi:inositol-3-phosphate synthase [Fimbriiglobus ruber]|uniref:Inositol-1-phosphate synthase n=1 Tax=Fimbriiglobus ruber TaxID=1908690 RepID=A0A225DXI0_9BACT|nr:inositol-3-phosphate synthase [Fimbriiglobus ruber]OWK43238.1 Inositol-1-phosphate synthase [Fimbriiglobus ruber]
MSERRVGLWLIGACGGVGSTTALGLAAVAKGLASSTGVVTTLPKYAGVPFDAPGAFVVGGHDIRQTTLTRGVAELHARSNVFSDQLLTACGPVLDAWSRNIRPGVVYRPNAVIAALADRTDVRRSATPRAAIDAIRTDLRAFKAEHALDQVVVVNVASTEPPLEVTDEHRSLAALDATLDRTTPSTLPTSSLYAYAALDIGFPYVNGTPSVGAAIPALNELAIARKVPYAGQDLKTGETLLKSVLAPLFARRNLRVLSWVGHNILGNRDGLVLHDPDNKASKVKSKDALLGELLGYKPQSHVSIEYIESLDDWKTAWDHIHFEGFLGTKMTLQFTWQGCDSLLAAPLVIDLARLALLAQRRGESGVMTACAAFFKSPAGVNEHDFGRQFDMLEKYLTLAADERR